LPSPCPCSCSRTHRLSTGLLPGLSPLGSLRLPTLQPSGLATLSPQPPAAKGVCVEGVDCAYGPGWCTAKDASVKPGKPKAYCHRGACNGPTLLNYPRTACSNTDLAQMNVTDLFHGLPKYWLRWLKDVPEFNAWMRRVIDRNGLKGLELDFDEVLLHFFDLQFGKASGVWLTGCWPPQRYAVVSGVVRAPSGRLRVRAGGLTFVVSAYDLSLRFWRLRADIQCHAGWYTIGTATHGVQAEPFPPEALEARGELGVLCEMTYTVMCLTLALAHGWISREVVRHIPQIVASLLQTIDALEVSPGCENHKHNYFHLLPYETKSCCEEVFAEDDWGCLVGGQFNGKVPGVPTYVRGVQCEPARTVTNTFTAKCDSVPGYYEEASPGVCRETAIPWSPVLGVDPTWSRALQILQFVAWLDVALTVALCWTLVGCLCCPRWCGRRRRGKSEVECIYRHNNP